MLNKKARTTMKTTSHFKDIPLLIVSNNKLPEDALDQFKEWTVLEDLPVLTENDDLESAVNYAIDLSTKIAKWMSFNPNGLVYLDVWTALDALLYSGLPFIWVFPCWSVSNDKLEFERWL